MKGRVFNLQVVVPKSGATTRDFNGFGFRLTEVDDAGLLESFGAVNVTVIGGFRRCRENQKKKKR